VRDALAERLRAAPFRIHVMGIEIARLACMDHNVGFRDGPAQSASNGA
jgi:hypothetical protein